MENALLIGLSRQMALDRELDVIANNMANVTTNGFKARQARFSEFLMPGASADESEEVRPGVMFDYDVEGRIVALEILDASEHLSGGADLARLSAA